MRFYIEYGGTDLSFVDRLYPRLTDVATLYGLYLDTGTLDIQCEYAQNLDGDDMLWYSHYQFLNGYTHKGDIIGHPIGGAARDTYFKMTHPIHENWRIFFDYEYLLTKERYGSIPGRKNEFGCGLDRLGDENQVHIEYEYENRETQGISTGNHLILLNWKRFF